MSARFVLSKSDFRDLPPAEFPEIALMGRSNVGKSSLLGRVLKRDNLVRTSRTPGRTQLLNLFVLDEKLAFADLPGYGYAKLPKTKRAEMDKMVQAYLRGREGLALVILIVDIRRVPMTTYDLYLADWLLKAGLPHLVVATKIDQIPKNRRAQELAKIRKELRKNAATVQLKSSAASVPQDTEGQRDATGAISDASPVQAVFDVVGFSSSSGEGRDELMRRIFSMVAT